MYASHSDRMHRALPNYSKHPNFHPRMFLISIHYETEAVRYLSQSTPLRGFVLAAPLRRSKL